MTHPITDVEQVEEPKQPPRECCPEPEYRQRGKPRNEGRRSEVAYRCASCGNEYVEVFTIRHVEAEDGDRLEAGQGSYCPCDDEAFTAKWRGKTARGTVEFVAECTCGRLYSDVYRFQCVE